MKNILKSIYDIIGYQGSIFASVTAITIQIHCQQLRGSMNPPAAAWARFTDVTKSGIVTVTSEAGRRDSLRQ